MMNRRKMLQHLGALAVLPLLPALSRATDSQAEAKGDAVIALDKPHAEWRGVVSAAAYAVLFEEDTEPSGSSPLNNEHREGTFVCAACRLPIFNSADKFESGTGWPSFTQPIAGHIRKKRDFKLIWPRTEYHCARCGGHQGHVFDDGPKPRGERWCNNGLALEFIPVDQPLPELRS
ncbi:MAG TPA: peptide-methionine (R)-S-oxide reductase MsrB [Dokdonella sp.]|uniref:peptide-methionine (R)-S-oxide reductase MsrB n=1 Tax=Dokdonella sp. TaxID=2291710 RepID=UPI002D80034C|nr:peptide-methionine (R)-S-oxide reductase MsrB [Dokdonella sp.]HET9031784.1 peptide-methionine (R)-S-oxide reductase MsrB [Dokdonella sp.]